MSNFWDADPVANAPAASSGDFWNSDPVVQPQGLASTGIDVAKQLGVGLATGVEGMPSTIPAITGLAGMGAQALLDKFAPGFTDPTRLENQQKLMDLASQARNGGIAQYLPQAQTPAGEAARSVGNFIPSALGAPGSLVRNAVAGTAAGLGAYGGSQAAPTPESQPYFEMGGALLGGTAGLRGAESIANRLATRAVNKAAPLSAIEDAAKAGYETAQEAGFARPIPQENLDNLAQRLEGTLNMKGPRASVAPGIHKAIEEIKTPGMSGGPDVADLVAARQNVKSFFQNPLPDPNKAGAAKILPLIDAEIEKLSPGTMQTLREADANYSAFKTGETLDKRIAKAQGQAAGAYSGMNLGNKLRQNATSMLFSQKEGRYLKPGDIAALEAVQNGDTMQNLLQKGSRLLGGGLGMHSAILGAGGLGIGYYSGHPELALLPVAGLGMRMLENRSILNQARNASAAIRARSPYAQSLDIAGPKPRASRQEAAALAALYALPAFRGILSPLQTN